MTLYDSAQAADKLLNGSLGVIATDTLYGIVARAADPQAVKKLYALKHREHKPGTVIAASIDQLEELGVDRRYLERVKKWWPGSISIETPLGDNLAYLHQETGRQGLRVVADERVRKLLEKTGPLLTSSANLPGEMPAITVKMAYDYFEDAIDFYLDEGERANMKPSTIARITNDGIEVIREGAVVIPSEERIDARIKPNCPFCLKNGLFKGDILYEDDGIFVTTPLGHASALLLIPKDHTEQLTELSDDWWKYAKNALISFAPTLDGKDYNLALNYGKIAGQTVSHLHFWIVPREANMPSSGKGLATLIQEVDNHS